MASSMSDGDSFSQNWEEIFNKFENEYKEAYFSIDKAIKLDEEGKINEALPLYECGLNIIDKALGIPLYEPTKPDLTWEKAIAMSQKLRKTRKEIIIRVENVKSIPQVPTSELPPSYEDVIASSKPNSMGTNINGNNFQLPGSSKNDVDVPYIPKSAVYDQELLANLEVNGDGNPNSPVTYSDLSQQLKEMKLAKDEEILFRCNNVQLFFIAPDGRVSSTPETNTLIIARVHDEALDQSKRTFLQVGSWVYPLIPEVSPCVRSEFGAFILPDINSEIEGAAVGIILPPEANEEVHELFTHLLNEISATGRSRRSVVADSSDKFSSKIVRGAAYLAHNLVRGAGSTARFLDTSTPKLIDRISPQADPQPINPTLQKTVEVAKTVSGKAVDVTDYLATKIGIATSALGRYLSPYIQKQGTRLLTSTMSMSEDEANEKINSMLNVTSDAVEGISTIYSGLDTAASILARSLANNTVQIIEYKYGQPAGALTNDALATFGNVYYTRHNFRVLRPKGIAKAAIRGAGQAILEDYRHSAHSPPHEEFSGSGPGDGSGFSAKV